MPFLAKIVRFSICIYYDTHIPLFEFRRFVHTDVRYSTGFSTSAFLAGLTCALEAIIGRKLRQHYTMSGREWVRMLHGTNDPRLIRGKTGMAPVALIDVLCRPFYCGVHFVFVPGSRCKKRGVAGNKEVKQKCTVLKHKPFLCLTMQSFVWISSHPQTQI